MEDHKSTQRSLKKQTCLNGLDFSRTSEFREPSQVNQPVQAQSFMSRIHKNIIQELEISQLFPVQKRGSALSLKSGCNQLSSVTKASPSIWQEASLNVFVLLCTQCTMYGDLGTKDQTPTTLAACAPQALPCSINLCHLLPTADKEYPVWSCVKQLLIAPVALPEGVTRLWNSGWQNGWGLCCGSWLQHESWFNTLCLYQK